MKKTYDTIYKYDTKGKARVWFMRQDGGKHQTVAGIKDGNLVTSEWTQCEATNVGRSNERNPVQQATFEIEAAYEKKLTREYHKSLSGATAGAHYFKPMRAEKYVPAKFVPGYAQPKLDGFRSITKVDGLWSREGKVIPGAPHIVEATRILFEAHPDLILDGELYNHEFRHEFEALSSLIRSGKMTPEEAAYSRSIVQLHLYDMPSVDDVFDVRYAALKKLIETTPGLDRNMIQLVRTDKVETAEQYDALHEEYLELEYEGSVKRKNKKYQNKKTADLEKRKEFEDAEFECLKILEGTGNWAGKAKKVLCRLPDGTEFEASIKGTMERAKVLLHETHKVVTVRYPGKTKTGKPRHGIAIKFWGEERDL